VSSQVHSTPLDGSGNAQQSRLLAAALSYATNGYPILPLYPARDGLCACPERYKLNGKCKPGKHPIGDLAPNAHQDATTDPARITTWWTLWPDANIGIALGPAGLVDIAPDSIDWHAQFVAFGLPPTMHFASGGGDGHEHYLYRRGEMPLVRIAKRGEYDLLTDGYCVAPPSVHESGRAYRWLEDVAPVEVPPWAGQFVLDRLAERDAINDDPVIAAETSVPPVALTPEQHQVWDGNGPSDDRSNSLVDIAKMLCDAGYQDVEGIASILAERDHTLGWHKYSRRRNAAVQYRGIAQRYGRPPIEAKLSGDGSGSHHVRGTGTINDSAAQPPEGVEILDPIKWRSHRETLDFTPPAIDWFIDGVLGRGLITELVAKVKLGKTTFMLQGIRAGIAGDDEYCGRAVKPLRAAYVTEEGFQTFRIAMDRYGLNDLVGVDAFFTVFDFETVDVDPKKLNLPYVIDSLIRHARTDRVDVVILDTLSIIAGLDEEDHSGKAAGVMAEVRRLASDGLAVGILRHSRKSGGEVGDAGRGSSAISGYCDVLLQIEPYRGDEDSTNLRVMRSKSRLGVYEPLVLEFDKATERYSAVGDVKSGSERMAAAIQKTLASFNPPARDLDSARTGNEIALATKGRRTSILEELKAMAWRGDVKHAERGRSTVYWSPLVVHLGGDEVVPGEPEPSGTPEPGETSIPLKGDGPEAIGSRKKSPPEGGIREPVEPKTRKEPTPEAVAKKAAEREARELARLEAADLAAPTLAYQAVTETYQLPQHLAMLSTAACSLDTETTGLSAHHDRMRTVNLSDGQTHLVIDGWKITDWSPLQRYLDEVGSVRMHTYLFDLAFLATVGVSIDPSKVVDVKTMSMVLESEEAWVDYTLQGIAKRHLAEHVAKTEQKRGWDAPVLRHAKLAYAAEDARVTFAAADALEAKLLADPDLDGLQYCLDLERDVQAATWWLASAGVPCDAAMLREAIAEQEALLDDRLQELNAIADVPAVTNWRSPKQVLPILQARDLDLVGTSVDHLMEAQSDDPIIDALLGYRSAGTCLGLLNKTLSTVAADGRIYASFHPIGAQTGRTSCSEPNLQQLPHETRARASIRPRDGRVFVRADYSQLQIVIAAWLSGDKNMQRILNTPGGDIHEATAQAVGCSRQQAKAINFGFLFGAGADTFRREQRKNGIVLTQEQAAAYRNTFMKTYPGIRRWHRSLGEWNTEAEVIDDTGSGRRRSRIFSNNIKANTPIQMAEAHGFKRALIALHADRGAVPTARLVMMVHDEIIAECDYADRHQVAQWMHQHMVNAMQPLVDGVTVEVEPTIVPSYSDDDKKHPIP
jgi:DNA polymerase I-like protein with 3'-5' exonuclease and polymerase domains